MGLAVVPPRHSFLRRHRGARATSRHQTILEGTVRHDVKRHHGRRVGDPVQVDGGCGRVGLRWWVLMSGVLGQCDGGAKAVFQRSCTVGSGVKEMTAASGSSVRPLKYMTSAQQAPVLGDEAIGVRVGSG
jgi:hypothetical protein